MNSPLQTANFRTFYGDPHVHRLVFTPEGILSIGYTSGAQPLLSRLYAEPPIALGPLDFSTNGRVALTFMFTTGVPYVVERTSDFVTWTQVSTGTTDTGYVHLESDAPAATTQFYRLRKQ